MKIINKRNALIGTIASILFLTSFVFNDNQLDKSFHILKENENSKPIQSVANFWNINNMSIYINNNWSETESTYSWCSGSGSWSNPYLIENVTVNGKQARPCIVIENTREYFVIRNCTLFNATTINKAGIMLNNVTNGSIIDNNINSNYFGVWGNSSSNITISGNFIRVNSKEGIYFSVCDSNKIKDNLVQDNDGNGIYLDESSENEITDLNIIHRNEDYGVYLTEGSNNNEIYSNYIGYNEEGCVVDKGKDNTFEDNDCLGDYEEEVNYGELEEPDTQPLLTTIAIIVPSVIIGIVAILILKKKLKKRSSKARDVPTQKQPKKD